MSLAGMARENIDPERLQKQIDLKLYLIFIDFITAVNSNISSYTNNKRYGPTFTRTPSSKSPGGHTLYTNTISLNR